jgi:hypothetical protein
MSPEILLSTKLAQPSSHPISMKGSHLTVSASSSNISGLTSMRFNLLVLLLWWRGRGKGIAGGAGLVLNRNSGFLYSQHLDDSASSYNRAREQAVSKSIGHCTRITDFISSFNPSTK